ncbi:MAG: 3-ketoacyl-ACP reductase [Firmicutes bacterium]|nr:3-ketoacyl-ACP reductase [Bacillota bacterium]
MGYKSYALVTGGARGMGRAISLYLAKNGFTVAALGTKDAEGVAPFIDELTSYGEDNTYIKCDISKEEDRKAAIDAFYDRYGRLDVLVNNAGVAPTVRADLLEMTEESFDRVLNVNLKGTFFFTQYAASRMIKDTPTEAPRCVIVTSSISAETSSINRGEYCISKAGLSMTAKLFADRLAPYGINCYEVRPGIISTDMTAGVSEKYQRRIDGGLLPIARMGVPEDAAKAVYGLAMGYFSYATGCVIPVDGGFALSRL